MLPADSDKQELLLNRLHEQGFGGMATNVPFQNSYVENEENWNACVDSVRRARKMGMTLWLYDEKGYPSGNAGGITLRDHPEWEARGLLCTRADSTGGQVAMDVPPGTLVKAAAFPLQGGAIDLDKQVDVSSGIADGNLNWTAPEGSWRVLVITEDRLYEGTHATSNYAAAMPYINLLMKEPTDKFISVTHAAYAQRLGDNLGETFVATFTDEPSLMSVFMEKKPWRPLPWSAGFSGEFKTRRGYEIEPLIPALFAEAGPSGSRARYDFWLTVAELVSENFFGQIQTWCRDHNILSGGHLLSEENILSHVPFYGDFFKCARRLDAPSIDCLTSLPHEVPWYIARLLGSVADLEGCAETMSETSDHVQRHRWPEDTRPIRLVSEEEIRGTINRQIVNGITTFTSYYSFAGLSDDQLRRLNTWVGRCTGAMRGGRKTADVAVLYPVESLWPHFEPSTRWCEEAPQPAWKIEQAYRSVSDALYRANRDFTYIDSETLVNGTVENGTLKYRGLAWRAIVLPRVDTLPQQAWDKLAEFWRSGGVVIAIGAMPANNEREFPAPDTQRIAKEIFGDAPQPGKVCESPSRGAAVYVAADDSHAAAETVPAILEPLVVPDLRVEPTASPIRYTHRLISGKNVYMIINESALTWEGKLTFAMAGPGKQFNPATGEATAIDGKDARVNVEGFGALLFEF